MPSKFIYLPVEPYQERWTEYQSTPNGTVETGLRKWNIPYEALRPDHRVRRIVTGQVLDVVERSKWAFEQVLMLQDMMLRGKITRNDSIFIEDFWHPGMEMIPYTMQYVFGNNASNWPLLYSYCYAQSVDPNDFTYPMAWWMRGFEQAWAKCMRIIFVADKAMTTMLTTAKPPIASSDNIDVVGLFYDSDVIRQFAGQAYNHSRSSRPRNNNVIFTSRWDKEKNPTFFIELVRSVMRDREDVVFHVCTGAPKMRSNDDHLLELLPMMQELFPDNFFLHEGLSKAGYYEQLSRAKVQFNCARQDFVSFTLLDATLMGCAPLYPNWLTFPGVLEGRQENLYENENIVSAKARLYHLLDCPTEDYSWVYQKYELALQRVLRAMDFTVPVAPSLSALNANTRR
jgi:glycosyltransferase involved in cell wall biosynthesis